MSIFDSILAILIMRYFFRTLLRLSLTENWLSPDWFFSFGDRNHPFYCQWVAGHENITLAAIPVQVQVVEKINTKEWYRD